MMLNENRRADIHMTIMVTCCVFPSGETLWFETKGDYLRKVVAAWKDKHPEYQDTGCTMGAVEIRMPIEKFCAISATNSIEWPEQ